MLIGQMLGVYEVVAKIGEGGMGEVYRARDTKLRREVAIKLLPDSFAADPDRVVRFQREAELLAALNHANIATVYGVEDSNGVSAIVMELVDGEDLAQRIARGRLPIDEALPIAKQIAAALEGAHEQGIVHRDLKPANIKIRSDGTVKVLDFGLAKALEPSYASSRPGTTNPTITTPAMTLQGVVLGTAAYMSPEQAKGQPVDKRSDIWAFGCVLFEMLSGTRPFDGDDVADTLATVLKGEPHWAALPPDVSPGIRALLKHALDKNKKTRIPDMSAVRFLLDDFAASDARIVPRAAPPTRPAWYRGAVLFVLVGLSAVAGAGVAWKLVPAPRPAVVVRVPVAISREEPFTGASFPVVALSPDGSKLAYVAGNQLHVRRLDESAQRVVFTVDTGVTASIYNPVFSPDGESLAFVLGVPRLGGASIRIVAATGGLATNVADILGPMGIDWTAAGILFAERGKGISLVSASPGAKPELLVASKPGEIVAWPSMMPDGGAVLFTLVSETNREPTIADWQQATVVAQSLRSGERKTLVTNACDARYVPTGHLVYASGGVMYAVPFDTRRLAVRGRPTTVVEGVSRHIGPPSTGAAHLSVSESGTLAYLAGPPSLNSLGTHLLVIDRDGKSTPLKLPVGAYVGPRVSPDGTRVTFALDSGRESDVSVYDLSGATAIRPLTFGGRSRYPLWSPDGQSIAFQFDSEKDGGIFWQRADGTTQPERLTSAKAGVAHVPESWSPDGKSLLFAESAALANTLWVLSLADRKISRFSDVESLASPAATFSPDGRWVAYGRRDQSSGDISLWVEPFPATGSRYRITGNGFRPLWSPDGKELFFGTRGQSWAVAVTTTPSFTFGNPTQLPISRYPPPFMLEREYDVMPNGQQFIFAVPVNINFGAGTVGEIQLVINWFEELKRRVPTR